MSWEVYGHAQPIRPRRALMCVAALFVAVVALGQAMVASRGGRLLAGPADTRGWSVTFSRPAYMLGERMGDMWVFIDPSLGRQASIIQAGRIEEGPGDDDEAFFTALWDEVFDTAPIAAGPAATKIGHLAGWQAAAEGETRILRLIEVGPDESYMFAFTGGHHRDADQSRTQFDALCDSVRLRPPE